MNELIYLDYNATTPLDERVLDSMMPFFKNQFGNSSSTHQFGLNLNKVVKDAKYAVAELINADVKEIVFTSGATESINLALKGIALTPGNIKKHIVTAQTEHKAVLDTCNFLESVGFEVTYLPVKADGLLSIDLFKQSIRKDTLAACIMLVNNETGVVQDVKSLSNICKELGVLFICDATQAVGKIPVDVQKLGIDIIAFSGHKYYAPKGVGILYISKEVQRTFKPQPLIHGGGHENGFRSGTLNVPAIVGIGKASEIALAEMEQNATYIGKLRDSLENQLLKVEGSFINGSKSNRIYNTINMCFPGIDANVLIGQLKQIAISNGSACTAAVVEPSHVLKAMGLQDDQSFGSLRISIGKYNTEKEIQVFIDVLTLALKRLYATI